MPANRRSARVVAVAAAAESRQRLFAIAVNCLTAAVLVAGLAAAALWL